VASRCILSIMSLRVIDWQMRLAALFKARQHAPVVWGVHDCCLFVADAVLACTGLDPAADLRGTYATEQQASAVLLLHGGLVGLAIKRAGPVVVVGLAQPGDIGLLKPGDGPASLAVCGGVHWFAPGPCGLLTHPARNVKRAWRCGA
jgi:hypothetical protein